MWFYFGVELFYVFRFFCFTSFVPRLKSVDLREEKANSDRFYVGNKLVYNFRAANTTKKKDYGTKLNKNRMYFPRACPPS